MNQHREYFLRSLVSDGDSTKVLQPRVASLDDPSAIVPSQLSSILMYGNQVVFAGGENRLNPAINQKCPHLVAAVPTIANQTFRFAVLAFAGFDTNVIQYRLDQGHFCGGSLLHVYSERSNRVIGQYQELCFLAAFNLPGQGEPFFARMNILSIKHSSQRTFCWSESRLRKARHRFRRTSISAQVLRRRWTLLFEPYFSGDSLHGAQSKKSKECPRSTSDHRRMDVLPIDSVGVWANIAKSNPIVCQSMRTNPDWDTSLAC